MGLFSNLFGFGKKEEKIKAALQNKALIVDVRTPAEFKSGSIKNAVNFPVQTIDKHVDKMLKAKRPVIAFCASGMRSAAAVARLKSAGIESYNAGSMQSMRKYLG